MYKKQVRLFKSGYMINDNENEAEHEKYRYGTNRLSPRHGHKYTTFGAQFMKKLSNTEIELKRKLIKKRASVSAFSK